MKEQLLKLQKVFAKAKGVSIELGLVDDLKKGTGELDAIIKEANGIESEMRSSGKKLAQTVSKTNSLLKKGNKMLNKGYKVTDAGKDLIAKVEKGTKELGLNAKDIPAFSEFEKKRSSGYYAVKSIEDAYWEDIQGHELDKF